MRVEGIMETLQGKNMWFDSEPREGFHAQSIQMLMLTVQIYYYYYYYYYLSYTYRAIRAHEGVSNEAMYRRNPLGKKTCKLCLV